MNKFIAPILALCLVVGAVLGILFWLESGRLQADELWQARKHAFRERHVRKVKDGGRLISLPESGLCGVLTTKLDLLPCDIAWEVSLMTHEPIKPLY